jgi:CheY-like chemotaxis protein
MIDFKELVLTEDESLIRRMEAVQLLLDDNDIALEGSHHGVFAVCQAFDLPSHTRGLLPQKTILVVDDDNAMLRMMSWDLYASGASVSSANDGFEALQIVGTLHSEYDLILMDVKMPIVDGFETARQLQHMNYQGSIVLFTANFDSDCLSQVTAAGCAAYIDKAVGPYHLLAVATHLCKDRA